MREIVGTTKYPMNNTVFNKQILEQTYNSYNKNQFKKPNINMHKQNYS